MNTGYDREHPQLPRTVCVPPGVDSGQRGSESASGSEAECQRDRPARGSAAARPNDARMRAAHQFGYRSFARVALSGQNHPLIADVCVAE